MQSFISYLIEKRSNPDKNEREDPFQQLRKYGNDAKHLYISYTEIDKIGINPQSTYDTPNGIYTYQLDWMIQNVTNIKGVPFAGEAPHIWVITPTTKVLNFNHYNEVDLDRDIEKLREKFNNSAQFDYTLQTATRDMNRKRNKHATLMWYFTKLLAYDNPNKWNAILRDVLGYSIIRDDGDGIIHRHEPFQTVFLTKSAFKVVEKLNNSNSYNLFNTHSASIKQKEDLKSEKKTIKTGRKDLFAQR